MRGILRRVATAIGDVNLPGAVRVIFSRLGALTRSTGNSEVLAGALYTTGLTLRARTPSGPQMWRAHPERCRRETAGRERSPIDSVGPMSATCMLMVCEGAAIRGACGCRKKKGALTGAYRNRAFYTVVSAEAAALATGRACTIRGHPVCGRVVMRTTPRGGLQAWKDILISESGDPEGAPS